MKAKCPHCFGQKDGCSECKGTGFIGVKLNTDRGVIFFNCPKCGADLGGRIPQDDNEIPENPTGPSTRRCIFCGEENTAYEYYSPSQTDQMTQKWPESENVSS